MLETFSEKQDRLTQRDEKSAERLPEIETGECVLARDGTTYTTDLETMEESMEEGVSGGEEQEQMNEDERNSNGQSSGSNMSLDEFDLYDDESSSDNEAWDDDATEDEATDRWEFQNRLIKAQTMQEMAEAGWDVPGFGGRPSQKACSIKEPEAEFDLEQEEHVETYKSTFMDIDENEESLHAISVGVHGLVLEGTEQNSTRTPFGNLESIYSMQGIPIGPITTQDAAGEPNTVTEQDPDPDPDPTSSASSSDRDHPTEAKITDPNFNRSFLTGALKALRKLRKASLAIGASPQLRSFVEGLDNLQNVIKIGLGALQSIFDGNIPSCLKEIYCFLHVAYALSRAEKGIDDFDLPPKAFREDLYIFRNCLPSKTEGPNELLSPQALFDEIVNIMWQEFQEGLRWVSLNLPGDISRCPDSTALQREPTPLTTVGRRRGRKKKPAPGIYIITPRQGIPITTTPKGITDMATSIMAQRPVFTIEVILDTFIFQEFVITLNKLEIDQFAFLCLSGVVNGLIQWTEHLSDSMFETADDGCKWCGKPYNFLADCSCCEFVLSSVSDARLDGVTYFYKRIAISVAKFQDRAVAKALFLEIIVTSDAEDGNGGVSQQARKVRNPRKGSNSAVAKFKCLAKGCTRNFCVAMT
ncbi:hypothetical protein TWF281_000986 [Arthrobotrys megalospora]